MKGRVTSLNLWTHVPSILEQKSRSMYLKGTKLKIPEHCMHILINWFKSHQQKACNIFESSLHNLVFDSFIAPETHGVRVEDSVDLWTQKNSRHSESKLVSWSALINTFDYPDRYRSWERYALISNPIKMVSITELTHVHSSLDIKWHSLKTL